MEVLGADADVCKVLGEIFGEFFGEGGDENAIIFLCFYADLFEDVVDLIFCWLYCDDGVEEAGGAEDLLDDFAAGLFYLVGAGGGGDVDDLLDAFLDLFEL